MCRVSAGQFVQRLWDETDPVLTNLERVLGLELPGRAEPGQQEEVEGGCGECGICYAETFQDGEMPTRFARIY